MRPYGWLLLGALVTPLVPLAHTPHSLGVQELPQTTVSCKRRIVKERSVSPGAPLVGHNASGPPRFVPADLVRLPTMTYTPASGRWMWRKGGAATAQMSLILR